VVVELGVFFLPVDQCCLVPFVLAEVELLVGLVAVLTPLEQQSLVATVTTESVAGHEIVEVLGIARGNTVRARNVGRDITQGIRNLAGGELAYSTLLSDARDQAIERMEADALEMGADAVVNVRMETSEVTQGASEVIAYGTAVKLA
jgi:uncharacterized protein YbjQ (UPF0145 family)